MEAIKKHFEEATHIKECWYDDNGNVIHYQHPAYPNHITREEVFLGGNDNSKNTGKKSAAELIENINAAETAEAATLAAESDTRKTVVEALDAKLKSFVKE